MKIKTVSKLLQKNFDDWIGTITDPALKSKIEGGTIITGGCIASMLLQEPVNDYDLYFHNQETAVAVAKYYVAQFGDKGLRVDVNPEGRIRLVTPSGWRGETKGDVEALTEPGEIEDTYQDTENKALATEDESGKTKYRPIFLTTNAITLSNRIQIVLRFYGEPDAIHESYDYVHCTNYWTSWEKKLVLRQEALESLLSKELRYVGSKYPVCSIIRLRKFLTRQWTINAGQILKILMQINDLELTDPKVLEDQLTGVDSAYFCQLISKLKEKDPDKVNTAYLVEIIDRIF